jgi:sugar phosphate isomerase/epimerase
VDILHRQMDIAGARAAHCRASRLFAALRRHALTNGVGLICLSIHQNFVSPKPDYLRQQIDHTLKCIEIAYNSACRASA